MARKFTSTYVHVTIERGENEHVPATVLAHELPCLQAKHGEGSVKIITDVPKDVLDYARIGKEVELDRDEEWGRLMSKYGMHPNFDAETVVYVYQNDKRRMAEFDVDELIADMGAITNSETLESMLDMLEDFDVDVESERPAKVESQLRELICEKLDEKGVEYRSNDDIKVLMAVAKAVLGITVGSSIKNAVKSAIGGNGKNDNIDEDGDGDITVKEIKAKLDVLEVNYKANDKKQDLLLLLTEELEDLLDIYDVDHGAGDSVEVLWAKVQEHEAALKTGSND